MWKKVQKKKKEFYSCSQKTKVETYLVSHMNECCVVGCTCKKKNDAVVSFITLQV